MYFGEVSTFGLFELTVAVITNTGVLSPVRVEFRTRGQFEQAMLFATMQVGRHRAYCVVGR